MKLANDQVSPDSSPYWGGDEVEKPAEAAVDRGDVITDLEVSDNADEIVVPAAEIPEAVVPAAENGEAPAEIPVVETPAAEIPAAETARSPMIPRSRFDQVNNKLAAAKAELEALQAQLAEGKQTPVQVAATQQEVDYQAKLVEDQTEIHSLLLDGKVAEAAQKQLDLNNRMVARASETARSEARQEVQRSASQNVYADTLTKLETQFEFINPDKPGYDDSMVTRVRSISNSLVQSEGYSAAEALVEAVETVAARFFPQLLQPAAPSAAAAPVVSAGKDAKKAATIAKNLALAGQQPAKLTGDSLARESESTPNIFDMTEAEFSALSAKELARLRGDVV